MSMTAFPLALSTAILTTFTASLSFAMFPTLTSFAESGTER